MDTKRSDEHLLELQTMVSQLLKVSLLFIYFRHPSLAHCVLVSPHNLNLVVTIKSTSFLFVQ